MEGGGGVCVILCIFFRGACFLCSWASETNGLHDPAHAIPAVAGRSDCLLDTLLDTLGVHPDLGDAVHHSGGDLCNASPAFSILTDSVVWFTFGLHRRQFAEDVFNAILVNLAVFSLDSDSNEKKKTDNLHSALTIDSDSPC